MPSMTTQGIVLRHADYREHDRMLTLLTPAHGRIDALCRGCKRPQSPLLSASEWFALGEYVLYTGKGRMTVTSCSLTEGFYPLRTHYECLQYATYLLSVAEAAAQPGEEAAQLFTLLARSLTRLAYSNRDARAVVAAFLAHFAAISGYRPRLSHCVLCGRAVADEEIRRFNIAAGGLVCPACAQTLDHTLPVTAAQARWMRDVLRVGIDKTTLPERDAPCALLADYVEARLEKKLRRGGLFG